MLLQTKLFVPVVRSGLVPRRQLLARLNAGLQRRLTLVAAPAGFGKTTLLANWGRELSKETTWRFAWLSLDAADDDLPTFFMYFIAALQTIDPHLGGASLELLQSSQVDNFRVIFTLLLNALAGSQQTIVTVLDDYHLITDPTIHDGILFLLENAPPHFHLVLSSRAALPFSLARLRARNQITEIRQADLRFSRSEAADFLNRRMALALPEEAVNALERRTEGWAAGLQMAALSLQNRSDVERFVADFTASNRYIFDYLVEEALARRPAGTREFLLRTSVLDRLCAPLCDAVLESEGSQAILAKLENANLFLLPLDDVRHWYRYHHLFADLLREHLRREQPELAPLLHQRASHWFERAGFEDEAVQYALTAADYQRAAYLVAQYSQALVHRGELNKLLAWMGRLPAEWRHEQPQLILNHAWARLFRGGPHEMEDTLSHLPTETANSLPYSAYLMVLRGLAAIRQGNSDEAIALAEKAEPQLAALESEPTNQSMRGVNAMILASGYRDLDVTRAERLCQKAATLCRESGNLIVYWTAVRDRSTLLFEQGQLFQARVVLLDGIQSEQEWLRKSRAEGRKLLAAAPIHVSLATLYYEWNQLDEAEAHLADAVSLLALIGPVNQSEGLAAMVRLRLAQGKDEAVLPLLNQLESLQERATDFYTRQRLAIALAETTCAVYHQEPASVLRVELERSLSALGDDPAAILAQARILLALARPAQALPFLETVTKQMQEQGRHGRWLSAMLLRCLAQYQLDEATQALDGLGRALSVAERSGYVRLFVDAGQPMAELLQSVVRHNLQSDYASRLLKLFPQADASIPPVPRSDIDSLSPRETEVLQLIAQGLTNKEIAAQLVIATSTAKRHTVNIYNKLGVNNRAEATARAYELGIIE